MGLGAIPLFSSHLPLRCRKVTFGTCLLIDKKFDPAFAGKGIHGLSFITINKIVIHIFQGKGLCVWPPGPSNTGYTSLETVALLSVINENALELS